MYEYHGYNSIEDQWPLLTDIVHVQVSLMSEFFTEVLLDNGVTGPA